MICIYIYIHHEIVSTSMPTGSADQPTVLQGRLCFRGPIPSIECMALIDMVEGRSNRLGQ